MPARPRRVVGWASLFLDEGKEALKSAAYNHKEIRRNKAHALDIRPET